MLSGFHTGFFVIQDFFGGAAIYSNNDDDGGRVTLADSIEWALHSTILTRKMVPIMGRASS